MKTQFAVLVVFEWPLHREIRIVPARHSKDMEPLRLEIPMPASEAAPQVHGMDEEPERWDGMS